MSRDSAVSGVEVSVAAADSGLLCERLRERTARHHPSGERLNTSLHTVVRMEHAPARAFVKLHHYSGAWPAVRRAYGLYCDLRPADVVALKKPAKASDLRLVGVAAFGVPAQTKVLTSLCAGHKAVELSRLVLVDEVAKNGESWFLTRAMRLVRVDLGVSAVIAYSDPQPRTTLDGRLVSPGHVGVIYQALGAEYLGRGSPRTHYIDAHGRVLAPRTLSKIRTQERGARAAERDLVMRGADVRRPGEAPSDWLRRVRPSFRRERSPGCHRYLWRWDEKGCRIALPLPWAFPRLLQGASGAHPRS